MVLLIALNPETVQLALVIDAIGLDIFLMLLEVQFLTLLIMFFDTKIKPIFSYSINLYSKHALILSLKTIRKHPENLLLATPSPAIFMNMLVFIAAAEFILNTH